MLQDCSLSILLLFQEVESVLRKIADFAKTTTSLLTSSSEELLAALGKQKDSLASVSWCSKILGLFELLIIINVPSTVRSSTFHCQFPMLLKIIVLTIDLTVLSYAGAYLDRFDKDFLKKDIAVINVLTPFANIYGLTFPSIKLRRYPF
jgi:hypothetical protein